MKTPWALAAILALVLLSAGCADGGRRIGNPPAAGGERAGRPEPTVVRVVNHNWAMIDVYAVQNGRSARLGEVETGGAAVFNLPAGAYAANDLRLRVELVGGRDGYETGPILAAAGQLIRLTIENHLALSSYAVEGT